jgi:hypothetical protein
MLALAPFCQHWENPWRLQLTVSAPAEATHTAQVQRGLWLGWKAEQAVPLWHRARQSICTAPPPRCHESAHKWRKCGQGSWHCGSCQRMVTGRRNRWPPAGDEASAAGWAGTSNKVSRSLGNRQLHSFIQRVAI